jgi:hypothetical protein
METIEIYGIRLDVYYDYQQFDSEYEITIQSIEDIKGSQNLYILIGEDIIDKIIQKISLIEQGR